MLAIAVRGEVGTVTDVTPDPFTILMSEKYPLKKPLPAPSLNCAAHTVVVA